MMATKIDHRYESSEVLYTGLDFSLEGMDQYANYNGFQEIREEINQFILKLGQCHMAETQRQRIHYLYLALVHLDNLDREIRASYESEELIRLEMIHGKIRSLKKLITEYIRQLAEC
jgi:hypothetical protein